MKTQKNEYKQSNATKVMKVDKNDTIMNGLVASKFIPARTIVGWYRGDLISEEERYKLLEGLSSEEIIRMCTYDLLHPTLKDTLIVPTDSSGNIKMKYINCKTLYINEPAVRTRPNCKFMAHKGKVCIITLHDILPGSELLANYGHSYNRNYVRS